MTCIRLLSAAALVEGMGLSVALALGATGHAHGGVSKGRMNQVVAAQDGATQGLEMFLAAQGSNEAVVAHSTRGQPGIRDSMDTLYVTRQPQTLGVDKGALVDSIYDKFAQDLGHTFNNGGLRADAALKRAEVGRTPSTHHIDVHDGKIWPDAATDYCVECMHALPLDGGVADQHLHYLPWYTASDAVRARSADGEELTRVHRPSVVDTRVASDAQRPESSWSKHLSQSSDVHLEAQVLDIKSKLIGSEPSPARRKALHDRTLRPVLSSPQTPVGSPEEREFVTGAEPGVVHRELPVEAQVLGQNSYLMEQPHATPLWKALLEGSSNIVLRFNQSDSGTNDSVIWLLNSSHSRLVCSMVSSDGDGVFWFNLFVVMAVLMLLLIAGSVVMWARVVDRARYNRRLRSVDLRPAPEPIPEPLSNVFADQAARGRPQHRTREDQRHSVMAQAGREITSRPRSRSSDSSSSRSSHRSPRSWYHPCAREGCPCPSSWDGRANQFCCLTCRDGTPCASVQHMRPSNWARLPSESSRSNRNRERTASRASPGVRAEVYTQSEPGQQSVRHVTPPVEGLAAADGRGPWYLCGCPRSCTTLLLCLSGPRPERCLACTTGSLFPPNGDYGGACACNCCQGPAEPAAPVATPGVRVMGRPLLGRLPFVMFMLCCSALVPLIEGAPTAEFSRSVSRLQAFLTDMDDPELQSFVIGLTVSVSLLATRRGISPSALFKDICDFIQGASAAMTEPSSSSGSTETEFEPDDPDSEELGNAGEGASPDSPRYSAFAMGGVLMDGGIASSQTSGQAQTETEDPTEADKDDDSVTSDSSAVDMSDVQQYLVDHPNSGRKGDAVFRQMLMTLLFFTFITCGNAVTCYTCYDQIEGCAGGDACLLHSRPHANTAVIAAGVGVISLASLLPIKFLRECTRSALDCIKMVANRPQLGTPLDISQNAMTVDQLVAAVQSGAAQPGDAMRECLTRLASAGNQLETNRLNALATLLSHMDKGSTPASGTGGRSAVLGTYSLAWALAGRIARQTLSVGVAGVAGQSGPSEAATPITQMVKLNITRPSSMAEFSDMITTWLMLCHATGLGHVLALGEFIRDVVHDTISKLNYSWQLAHELLLVYFEVVETTSDPTINIRSVFAHGSQDTYLKRANDSMRVHYSNTKVKDEAGPSNNSNANKSGNREVKWNGNYDRNATTTCLSYNLGTEHKARSLNDKGTCKHNHVCDHWVSDKGPGGTCGGRHPRSKCDNPNKCDQKVT